MRDPLRQLRSSARGRARIGELAVDLDEPVQLRQIRGPLIVTSHTDAPSSSCRVFVPHRSLVFARCWKYSDLGIPRELPVSADVEAKN